MIFFILLVQNKTMVQLDWSKILYKNPAPTTLEFTGSKVVDKRFDNYKNNYNVEQMQMLQYFKEFEISETTYDTKQPWSRAIAESQESQATHYLYNENFQNGTFRIIKPGYYVLQENIIFSPDPKGDDSFMPTDQQIADGDYPTAATQPTGYYHMGFFGAITIEADGVVLNLNGYTIKQSEIHKLQQRFFACIELASAPFIQAPKPSNPNNSAGPSQFGPTPVRSARNTYICNGKLLTSSHHGIHANNNENIVIENITFSNFEVGAIQLNGSKNVIIRNIMIANGSDDVRVNAMYSQGRFLLRFLEKIKATEPSAKLNLSSGTQTIQQVLDNLKNAMNVVVDAVKNKKPLPTSGNAAIFNMNGNLIDGNRYGIVMAQKGPVVGPFKLSRSESGANESIAMHDIMIENLQTNAHEILACSTGGNHDPGEAYGGARAVDAVGGVIRMLDIMGGPAGPKSYKPNVLTNAQLMISVSGLADKGKTNIPDELVQWALSGANTLDSVINGTDFYFVGLGDSMGHHMKGDIGVFIQGAKDIILFDVSICNMVNHSSIGTEFKQYPAYLEAPGLYLGTTNTGVEIVASENVEMTGICIEKVQSICGVSKAIECIGESKNVNISDYKIVNVTCGRPSLQGESPNPEMSCEFISIDKECFDQVVCSNKRL